MENEHTIYNEMWNNAAYEFCNRNCQYDKQINNPNDTRRGVTVLAYLQSDSGLNKEIDVFLNGIRKIEPRQYFYPLSDRHLTILSIVTCVDHYRLDAPSKDKFIKTFHTAMNETGPINIHFKGITASPGCVLLQGFDTTGQLALLRQKLRHAFKHAGPNTSMDSRYTIRTAHSTLVRFKTELAQPAEFLNFLEKYRNYDFGVHTIDCTHLVFNNWYQQEKHTTLLASTELPA